MSSSATPALDGVLVIDKPSGPTSHDVVARVRRACGGSKAVKAGHTGTLDPLATGVLPLVLGRATRLAQFLSGSVKTYDATIRIGFATDTFDARGTPTTPPSSDPLPAAGAVAAALARFSGTFLQAPPTFSAKKIDGVASYRLARKGAAVQPRSVEVTVHRLALTAYREGRAEVSLECSAGFYVRSLASDLGQALGCGAHVEALRRVRAGAFTLQDAVPLAEIEDDPETVRRRLIPLARLLTDVPAVVLTASGLQRTRHGNVLGPADVTALPAAGSGHVRLLDSAGELVAIAQPAPDAGLLHPVIVLS